LTALLLDLPDRVFDLVLEELEDPGDVVVVDVGHHNKVKRL
jgi:hypothetical protein